MRVLITGGAGFIGSHLCERLVQESFEITCLDNFNDSYDPGIKRKNIEALVNDHQIRLYEADIRDSEQVKKLFSEYRFDGIFHLAARAGVRPSIQNPQAYQDVNIRGSLNIFELARKFEVPKIVFASSSSVYGFNKNVPFSESHNVDNPVSPYAATKKAGELIAYTYHHLYQISINCIRFFTVYGPRQRPDMAIRKFTRLIDRGESIPVYGDGSSQRDYTYISDIIDGLVKAFEFCTGYEIYNLGDSRTTGLLEMIRTIEKCLGKDAQMKFLPFQSGDVEITFADISKAREKLDYSPKVYFEEGMQRFICWYKQTGRQFD
jgi:UDP-glucuronate 4-epimerase